MIVVVETKPPFLQCISFTFKKQFDIILKDKLCEELEDFSKYKSFTPGDIEAVKNIFSSLKNMKLCEMYESDDGYPEYEDRGTSYASTRNEDERKIFFPFSEKR